MYFSEETSARFYADERVVAVLNRPALSNTYTFKTGENVDNIQFAILQTDDSGNRAWGTASVQWALAGLRSGASGLLPGAALAVLSVQYMLF